MKSIRILAIILFVIIIKVAMAQPDCNTQIKKILPSVQEYMSKYLGFKSTEGVKIECPTGYESKSIEWRELVGNDGSNDIYVVEGVAITPQAVGGGYYEVFFKMEYNRWPNKSVIKLSDTWTFSWSNVSRYVPHNVPSESITEEDKVKYFLDYISNLENLNKYFNQIPDYVKVNSINALGKINHIGPSEKEIFLKISGEKIVDADDNNYYYYRPESYNVIKLTIRKNGDAWTAAFGTCQEADYGKKYTILKPLKTKSLGVDGWDAVYQKMQITEGELVYMSENLAARLDKRMKEFAEMMNKGLSGNYDAEDFAKIKTYMSPEDNPDELAQKWIDLNKEGLDCGIKVNRYSCSGEVKREDKGGVKAYYNFEYYRAGAKTPEETALYKKCGVAEDRITKQYTKREGGQISVKLVESEWYLSEFPKLEYFHDGTKRTEDGKAPTKKSNTSKKASLGKFLH